MSWDEREGPPSLTAAALPTAVTMHPDVKIALLVGQPRTWALGESWVPDPPCLVGCPILDAIGRL